MRKNLYKAIIVLSLIGLAISSYLAYSSYSYQGIVCGINEKGSCNVVLNGPYAKLILNIPNSFIGAIGFLALLILGYLGIKGKKSARLIIPLSFVSLLFILYLAYLVFFVLRSFCIWCFTVWVLTAVIFICSMFLTRKIK